MKTRRIWSGGLIATLAVTMTACDMDGLTDVNRNPNNPTDVPAPTLFTNAARLGTSRWLGNANLRQFELLAQHMAELQYPESDTYVRLSASFTTGNFDGAYSGELKDLHQVIRKGRADNRPGYWAPGVILRSWQYGIVTDLFGDVPYSSALQGDSVQLDNRIQPEYDTQQSIYNSLFANLGEAVQALNVATPVNLGAADPLYGGDRVAWQRFGNSLRLRHAMRIVNVDPTKANTELTAALAAPGGVFTTNAHMAQLRWPGGGVNDNPWWTNFQTRDDHRVSDRLMFYLRGWNPVDNVASAWEDPRLPIFAQTTAHFRRNGTMPRYGGLPNGGTHGGNAALDTITSRPGTIFYGGNTPYGTGPTFAGRGATMPSYLMTTAEVQFILAEAAARGMGGLAPAAAQGYYEAGIRASMDQWFQAANSANAPAAEVTAYLARPEVAYRGGVEGLKQIATQKWIALYADGIQAWSEWRRTCQPEGNGVDGRIRPGVDAVLSSHPRRLQYSQSEATANKDNLEVAIARQGADLLTTRIWWDKAPDAAPTYFAGCGQR